MANIVRAALIQATWTGDQQSMIDRSVELAMEAAGGGAQILDRKSVV